MHRVPRISLTQREEEVFSVLLKVGSNFNATIRAAGGWVRDKLLGLESDDIDIALDTCDGETFARAVRDYAINETKLDVSTIGEIKANPDKSKHLQTATFVLNGISLDTNNLRSETYTEDSRIPQTRFGTPREDAERRDFTINALFYNANSCEIEDHTQLGLSDLESSILRTPLPPQLTFSDDPLRIIRALRFAARFGLHMDPLLAAAIADEQIRGSLTVRKENGVTTSKVSGERIGTEITKMFSNRPTAKSALSLLIETGVADAVCDSQAIAEGEYADWFTLTDVPNSDELSCRQSRIFHFCLLTIRLRTCLALEGKKKVCAAYLLLKEILRVPKADAEAVALVFDSLPKIESVLSTQETVATGRVLRVLKEDWLVACLVLRATHPDLPVENFQIWVNDKSGLRDCWLWRAPFDGDYLHEQLRVPKSKRLGELIDFQLDLLSKGVNDKDEILGSLKSQVG